MKYVYIILAICLLGGGSYYFFQSLQAGKVEDTTSVPVGFHRMPDGTLMQSGESMEAQEATTAQSEAVVGVKSTPAQATVTLDVNARVFAVQGVNYGYDIKEIKVKEGDTVTINFESTDGFHDFVIDEFAVATKRVQPGTKTSATFVADKKGAFEYYCSVGQHRLSGMVGKLIVE